MPASVDVTAASSNSASSNTSNTSSSTPTSNYKVKSGDTLIGIANSIGVSAQQVAAVNSSFDAKARLQRGQTIKVPASKAEVNRQLNDQPTNYKVQSGDTLTGVAKRYNIGLSDLASANGLSSTSNLILGRTITIPASGNSVSIPTSKSSSSGSSNTATTSSSGKSWVIQKTIKFSQVMV